MIGLFNTLVHQPLYNLLITLVAIVPNHDMGLAILAITILIRAILHPFSVGAFRSQRLMQRIQPELAELKKKFKDDKQGLTQATMALYKEHKVNPFSSCLPLLLQLPILIGLYQVLNAGLGAIDVGQLYSFVPQISEISSTAFGFLQLHERSYVLAILAGAAQFIQTRMLQTPKPVVHTEGSKDEEMAQMMNKQMMYVMPVMTVFIAWKLPAGIGLYWFLGTVLTVGQQWYIFRALDKEHAAKNK